MTTDPMEIPKSEWEMFCKRFSRSHRHWMMRLGVTDAPPVQAAEPTPEDSPMHIIARDAPLKQIELTSVDHGPALSVTAGDETDQIRHVIHRPQRICLERNEAGEDRGLRVEDEAEQATVLRFRAAASPEEVDGIVMSQWP